MGRGALPLQSEEKHPPEQGQSELEAPHLPLQGLGCGWKHLPGGGGWDRLSLWAEGPGCVARRGYYGLLNPAGVSSSGQPPTAVPQAEGPASNEDTFCEPSAQH